jgi:hypothetical protein
VYVEAEKLTYLVHDEGGTLPYYKATMAISDSTVPPERRK